MKKRLFAITLMTAVAISGCSSQSESAVSAGAGTASQETSTESVTSDNTAAMDTSGMFSDRDFEIDYDESKSAIIQLNGNSTACSSNAVQISGSTITITDEGTYILSGTLDDGMIIVNTDKSDKTQLVLNGVTIHSETSAPIYILQSDKVFLTTAEGTTNTLSNGGTFTAIDDNNIDAVIFSKEDLTLNGAGTLVINSPAGHGIVSKDSLKITSGTYNITCASHALSGKDDVCIANAGFLIASGKDGIHAENSDDASLGSVYIQSGTFTVTAGGDGISASADMLIEDGTFEIAAGGGSENGESHSSGFGGGFMGGERPGGGRGGMGGGKNSDPAGMDNAPADANGEPAGMKDGRGKMDGASTDRSGEPADMGENPADGNHGSTNAEGKPARETDDATNTGGNPPEKSASAESENAAADTAESSTDSTSMKGIQAAGNLTIHGGTFRINSADDGIHSNASVTVTGGTFEIAAGDDALHADDTLTVTDGTILITESYEGLEGLHVIVSGGDITLNASDDGLNAAGGTDASGNGGRDGRFEPGRTSSSNGSILISGGTLNITAYGDGIDANGTLEITGGDITVTGPTQGDTSTLDYDVSGTISGGTFIGTGAAGMAQGFSDSEQGVIFVRTGNQSADAEITLTDNSGNVILTHTPNLEFAIVILSSPDIISGEAYTLTAGTFSEEVTAN